MYIKVVMQLGLQGLHPYTSNALGAVHDDIAGTLGLLIQLNEALNEVVDVGRIVVQCVGCPYFGC